MKKTAIRIAAAGITAVMTLTALSSMIASAAVIDTRGTGLELFGHAVTEGSYQMDGADIDFRYSDGYFEVDPVEYQPHMATTSLTLAHASCTVIEDGDYSHGSAMIEDVLRQMGFTDIYASESYSVKPTTDSVACAIGCRDIETANGTRKVVALTVRSAGYEQEWTSNVTLGKEGDAAGFSHAADQVVNQYLAKYIAEHGLAESLENGEVDFWVTGYSRGGATANLAAKQLIDSYQEKGDRIYAYCIEAPQGASLDRANHDVHDCTYYRSIHNVINPYDLVPYVAPTAMGFCRHGVDHYLTSADFDSYNLYSGSIAGIYNNNLSDNLCVGYTSYKQLDLVRNQIRNLIPNPEKQAEYMPYEIMGKHLQVSLTSFGIADTGKQDTARVIERFVTGLVKRDVPNNIQIPYTNLNLRDALGNVISRDAYVDRGVQQALQHFMQYINSGADLKELIDSVDKSALIRDALLENAGILLSDVKLHGDNAIEIIWNTLVGDGASRVTITLDNAKRAAIANSIVRGLSRNAAFMRKLEQEFPGGADIAMRDVKILIENVLISVCDLDPLITMVENISGLMQNHCFIQTLAWLRSYDSWYDSESDITVAEEIDKTNANRITSLFDVMNMEPVIAVPVR